MKYIIINGPPRAGKDTFVTLCNILSGHRVINVSTVDFVKEIAEQCGWDGTKTEKNRKFLSDLKKVLTDWDDLPNKKAIEAIQSIADRYDLQDKGIAFIHIREPQEIEKFKNQYGAITLFISRNVEKIESNESDKNVANYDYDYYVFNNGSMIDLWEAASDFLNELDKS